MPTITDPAAELAEMLTSLVTNSDQPGSRYLASRFGVDEWSADFYRIVFAVLDRIADVERYLVEFPEFEEVRGDMESHLHQIKQAFGVNGLSNAWIQFAAAHLNPSNIQPLKMLSPALRAKISYPKLDSDETSELLSLVAELQQWLAERQLEENDFIRQALTDGLAALQFRLEKLQWLGWGYCIESLEAVIMAYLALEGQQPFDNNPQAAAVLKRMGIGLKRVFELVGVSKDIVERTDFVLRGYGLLMLAQHTPPTVRGLIASLAS